MPMKEIVNRLWPPTEPMRLESLLKPKFTGRSSQSRNRNDSDLEVEINGEHTFFLSKRSLVSYSGSLFKILSKANLINRNGQTAHGKCQRVTLYDFPGGPEAFEMAAIFCYNSSDFQITPSNVSVLRIVSEVLEMSEDYAHGNLIRRTEEFLTSVDRWDWHDILTGLKGCDHEDVFPMAESLRVVQRYANALAGKVASSLLSSSPLASSPDSENCSIHTNDSQGSLSSNTQSRSWWFSDVSGLSIYLMERVVKALFTCNIEHGIISRFLLYYLKYSLSTLGYSWALSRHNDTGDEDGLHDYAQQLQRQVLEAVVSLLSQLESGSTSCRSLFNIFRMAIVMDSSKLCRTQLERMIGLQLHKATLDNILIPSIPPRCSSIYDVDVVLRLIWYFLKGQASESQLELCRIRDSAVVKVGKLVDIYLSEIAPDAHLHPHRFQRLAKVLPSSARPSHDDLYRAVDIYLEAHPHIRKAEAKELCEVVDYQRLSFEACSHIQQNPRFPAQLAKQALVAQREMLMGAINPTAGKKTLELDNLNATQSKFEKEVVMHQASRSSPNNLDRQVVVHQAHEIVDPRAYKQALVQNEELKVGLSQMQSKVTHLEKMCKSMRSEVVDSIRIKRMIC